MGGALEGEPHLCRGPVGCPYWWSPGWRQSRQFCPLSCPSGHWAQDLREGGGSEKDSRLLLWPQEVVAGRGTLAEGAGV